MTEQLGLAELLLQKGVKPLTGTSTDSSPLCIAVQKWELGLVRRLLQIGADPISPDQGSPIRLAAAMSKPEILAILLGAGGSANVPLPRQSCLAFQSHLTPLHTAIKACRPLNVDVLLPAGADPQPFRHLQGLELLSWVGHAISKDEAVFKNRDSWQRSFAH
jgi:ankyrin repeat protein